MLIGEKQLWRYFISQQQPATSTWNIRCNRLALDERDIPLYGNYTHQNCITSYFQPTVKQSKIVTMRINSIVWLTCFMESLFLCAVNISFGKCKNSFTRLPFTRGNRILVIYHNDPSIQTSRILQPGGMARPGFRGWQPRWPAPFYQLAAIISHPITLWHALLQKSKSTTAILLVAHITLYGLSENEEYAIFNLIVASWKYTQTWKTWFTNARNKKVKSDIWYIASWYVWHFSNISQQLVIRPME
jgi:hypothetical protein